MTSVLTEGSHRFELASGGFLHVVVRGPVARASTPLLLLPSLGGSAGAWGAFARQLARTERVVAIDPRGFGTSSEPSLRMGTRDLAGDVAELLDRTGIESATVFGISFGGLLASWVGVDAARHVARLVLASTAASGRDYSVPGMYRASRMAECLVEEEDPRSCVARELVEDDESEAANAAARSARKDRWSRAKLARFLAIAALHSLPEAAIARLTRPVLLLSGARDPILHRSAVGRFAARLADVEQHVLPDVGHDLVDEAPDAVARYTSEFVRAR